MIKNKFRLTITLYKFFVNMCGIIGVFNKKDLLKLVKTGLRVIEHRGRDESGFYSDTWESTIRNPKRYGQSIIADSDVFLVCCD